MRTTAYFKAIMVVYGKKHLQVSVPKKKVRPVLLDTLAAMYVACYMFLILCFDLSKSHNGIRFQKVHIFKTKITKTAEKV